MAVEMSSLKHRPGIACVVVPRHLAAEVAEDGAEQERLEHWVLGEVKKDRSIFGLYPPDEDSRKRYEASKSKG